MTIIQERNDVQTRVRRRRRRNKNNRPSKDMRRGLIVVSVCLVMVFGGYFGVRGELNLNNGAFAAEQTIYKTVTVYQGDTIWAIAAAYTEPSKDVRKLIKEICDLNDVSSGKIYPGQVLIVPVPANMA